MQSVSNRKSARTGLRLGLAGLILAVGGLTLIPATAAGATVGAAGPQGPSCGTVKVKSNQVIVGQTFYKGTYEVHTMGMSCRKVLGKSGIFQEFINLRDNEKLPSPWRYLEGAVGAPKFVKGPGTGFRVQRISD